MSKKLKKIVSITATVTTIAWMSGIGMLAPLMANAVVAGINEGDMIKTANNPDVYIVKYMGAKQFKRLILSPSVFNSYQHLKWENIKTVTQATIDSFTVSTLVRAEGDPKVYNLWPVPNSDNGGKHWVNMTADQFTACGTTNVAFDWDSIYQINAVDRDSYSAEADDTTCTLSTDGGGGVPSSGTLSVALSPSTAPAQTIVANSAAANMASFSFTAPSNSSVKVTTLKLKRIGVSGDTTLSAVYLYNGINRLTDSASVSSGVITWNNSAGIFTVPAGSTMTITVKSDILTGTAGQTVGVALIAGADVVTDGASVSGAFPINGNLMTIATASSLASVSFGTVTPSSDGTPAPQNGFSLWKSTATIGTRAVDLTYITFRQIGSVLAGDLANFKLMIDGVQVGNTVATFDSNGYVTFDLSSTPKRLETGSRVVEVLVDIIGGSNRTTSLSLRYVADASFVDTQYGVNIVMQAAGSTFSARSSTAQTIASGSLTITKRPDSPSANIVNNGTNITLAKFDIAAFGEPVKIESLTPAVIVTNTAVGQAPSAFSLRNGALYANGVQVGSTQSLRASSDASATSTVSLGSSLIVVPGSPVILEIKADIYDDDGSNDITSTSTIRAVLATGSSNAQRTVKLDYFNAPTAETYGNTLSVKEGSVNLVKYTGYSNNTAIAPKTAYKIGEWRLTAGTTETINLTSINADFDNSGTHIRGAALDLSNCYITYADKTTSIKSTVSSTTNGYSISYQLAAGATIPIALYCNVITGTSGALVVDLTTNGTTASSGTTANSSTDVAGQTITWASAGTLTTAATGSPLDQLAYGGQTVESANYEINAANDTFMINQVAIKFASATQAAIVSAVYLYDGQTLLNPGGTVVDANGLATTTGMSLTVNANTTKTLTVKVGLNNVGTGNAAAALNASTTLDTLLVFDSNGNPSYVSDDRAGNAVVVYKSYPTVTLTGSSATITNDSSQTIYKFTVAPSAGGSVSLKQVTFDLSWTDLGPTQDALELEYVKFLEGSTDISDTVTIKNSAGAASVKAGSGLLEADGTGGLIIAFTTEKTITSATEFTIKAIPKNFNKGTTSSDSVAITLPADGTPNTDFNGRYVNYPAGTVWGLDDSNVGDASTAANFIWSDRDVIPHLSASGSSSNDWFSGNLVKNLPLDPIVLRP